MRQHYLASILTYFTCALSLCSYNAPKTFEIYARPTVFWSRTTHIRYFAIHPSPESPIPRQRPLDLPRLLADTQTQITMPHLYTQHPLPNHWALISSITVFMLLTYFFFFLLLPSHPAAFP